MTRQNWWSQDHNLLDLKDFRVPFLHHLYFLFWTLLISASSLLYALEPNLKTAFQWQTAYTSWATLQGQLPYLDNFSQAGFFYHGFSVLSNYLGGPYLFIGLQAVCLYLAGIYLHKIGHFLTKQAGLGRQLAGLFYLFNLAFGLGGFYPMQLASPFVLMGLWFLLTHWTGLRRDEGFIAYGFWAGLALLFEPKTLLFWGLALIFLLGRNALQGLWARGAYQFLSLTLGLMLLGYPVGYLMLTLQLPRPYLEQTLLTNWPLLTGVSLLLVGGRLLLLGAGGLLTGLVLLPISVRKIAEQTAFLALMSLSGVIYLAWSLLSPERSLHDLLLFLPFGLVLAALPFTTEEDATEEPEGSQLKRRQRSRGVSPKRGFLAAHAFLPVVVLVLGLAVSGYGFASRQGQFSQSQQVAAYLSDRVLPGEHLVVWDDRAQVYLDTQTLSGTSRPLAVFGGKGSAQENLFVDEFLQGGSSYVLVNKSLPLPEAVHQELMAHYKPVTLEGIDLYTLYELD